MGGYAGLRCLDCDCLGLGERRDAGDFWKHKRRFEDAFEAIADARN